MRLSTIAAALLSLTISPAGANCFQDCLETRLTGSSDDIAVTDAARDCRQVCDAQVKDDLETRGLLDQVKDCRGEPLSLEDFRKVRGASPSYHVQSNIFIWDVSNPFPDRVLTRIEVSTQTMELNELGFTGVGLVPPAGTGTFVIPGFFEGYPAVRFSAKVQKIWACPVR